MAAPAAPQADEESRPFWEALARHQVLVQACPVCRRRRFPRMPACPYCAAAGGDDVVAAGTGRVYSWIRVHRDLTGTGGRDLPYVMATVDLDEGPRLVGRLEPPEGAVVGLRVRPCFVDHPGWTELRFAPEGSSG